MVVRREYVTLPDTETHSRFEIETSLNVRHAIRSLNFAVLTTYVYTPEKNCVYGFPALCVCMQPHRDSYLAREEKQRAEMKPEGSIVDFIGNVPGTVISLTPA